VFISGLDVFYHQRSSLSTKKIGVYSDSFVAFLSSFSSMAAIFKSSSFDTSLLGEIEEEMSDCSKLELCYLSTFNSSF